MIAVASMYISHGSFASSNQLIEEGFSKCSGLHLPCGEQPEAILKYFLWVIALFNHKQGSFVADGVMKRIGMMGIIILPNSFQIRLTG